MATNDDASGGPYHRGQRDLQDAFDSRRIADRLAEKTYRDALNASDRELLERADMFFLATADTSGAPDCSYKGGDPGFVRVISDREIAWGDYDGNGQFRSLGNVLVNAQVALLVIDWSAPSRLRIHGRATVVADDPLRTEMPGAQMVVRVAIDRVFPNCPRYVHTMRIESRSKYLPRASAPPLRPGWKDDPRFADALSERDRTPR